MFDFLTIATPPKLKEISYNFEEGQIIKMSVATRSHVTKPYYVRVNFYDRNESRQGKLKMITSIPGEHTCNIRIGSNWEYHYPRMEIIGDEKEFGHLLYNQDLT